MKAQGRKGKGLAEVGRGPCRPTQRRENNRSVYPSMTRMHDKRKEKNERKRRKRKQKEESKNLAMGR